MSITRKTDGNFGTVVIAKERYAVYKYTLSQVHHITAIRSNTPIRHCSIFFPLKLNNPSVTSDVSSFQAKWLPRLTSQTNSAHSPCNSAVNHSSACIAKFKNSQKFEEKSYDYNVFTNVIRTKRIFLAAKKKFGVGGTLINMSTCMLLLGVLSFRYNCNEIVISFSFWQKSPSTYSSVLYVYLTIILPHA